MSPKCLVILKHKVAEPGFLITVGHLADLQVLHQVVPFFFVNLSQLRHV